MKTVKYEVKSAEKASRWELLVRLVYWIPLAIVLAILQMIACACLVVQFLLVLIAGKRNATLSKFVNAAVEYGLKLAAYYFLLTDERPEIIPEL
ncbi:hypothetical protein AUJ16_02160 [Candidatus Micrarchaeota archaeon CG1_02_60_51]|nr:MAG: hypothetical protein AUJ16_02160 [Candidatus Micrarchaeota archaeon CG1_02_60_51]